MTGNPLFSSPLAPVITRYLDLKVALGRCCTVERAVLRSIDAFLVADGAKDLTSDSFRRWVDTQQHLKSGVRRDRMRIVRNLCLYRRRTVPSCFVPDETLFPPLHQYVQPALLHGPEQITDLPVPVAESPGAVRIGHPERSHLVEYLAPNSVFNSLPRQRSSPHLRPDDRLVTIDRVLHHASLGVA